MTDDIRFKITADEQGAVASFKRLRQEILNNEHGLKSIGQEGKMSGKALKDMASFLGPEFQILGDRLDHVSGALQDIKGAGLLAKASLIGLVATAGFQVGQMIGNWVFETEKWKQELDDALKLSSQLNSEIAKNAGGRAAGMSPEQLQQEMVGLAESIQRQTEMVNKSEQAWSNFATADYWVIGENNRRKEVEGIKANIESQRELMKVYRDAMKQQAQKARAAEEAAIAQKEADAEKKRLDDERRALQAQEALTKAQDTFLEGLKLEIVRLKEGEEAYTRLKLAKQGFTEETIAASLAMQSEIEELKKAQEIKKETKQERDFQAPGMVQATQQRFITRGTGSSVQDKILQEMKQQIKLQQEQLAETRKTNNKLSKIPTEEA